MEDKKKLTAKEAAAYLGSSRGTISNWCVKGKFPNAEKITTSTGEVYWLIPLEDLVGVEIKMGRPRNGS